MNTGNVKKTFGRIEKNTYLYKNNLLTNKNKNKMENQTNNKPQPTQADLNFKSTMVILQAVVAIVAFCFSLIVLMGL